MDNDYRAKQYRELPEEQKEAILRMEENEKALLQTYFGMTPEEAGIRYDVKCTKNLISGRKRRGDGLW